MVKRSQHSTPITTEGLPLVAVDMGGASFKFVIAEPTDPNLPYGSPLRILDAEDNFKYHCLNKGIIINPSEASYMLHESFLHLQKRLCLPGENPLPTSFALLGGKSMRCIPVTAKRTLGYRASLQAQLLDDMYNECLVKFDKQNPTLKAFYARPIKFIVDDDIRDEVHPGDMLRNISATYSTFFGHPDLLNKVTGSFDRAGKSIEQQFARPSALVEALATEQDELVGLAIIDMGYDTTTFSAFKDGRFITCKVAPLGSHNITKDLQQLGISLADAERLKLRFGSALPCGSPHQKVRIRAAKEDAEPVIVSTEFLSTIITSRLYEIMQPIFRELANLEEELGQVYITGGGSKMPHMLEYIQANTSLPVAYGSHADWLDEDTPDKYYAPEYSAVIGALLLGAKHRQTHPNQPIGNDKVPSGKKSLGELIKNGVIDLFHQE